MLTIEKIIDELKKSGVPIHYNNVITSQDNPVVHVKDILKYIEDVEAIAYGAGQREVADCLAEDSRYANYNPFRSV